MPKGGKAGGSKGGGKAAAGGSKSQGGGKVKGKGGRTRCYLPATGLCRDWPVLCVPIVLA